MRIQRLSIGLVLILFSLTASADVPVTFQSGTPASAAEVNQNFSDLDSRLNASLGGILIARFVNSAAGVTSAACPIDSLVLSANCTCDGDGSTRNFGILFGCDIAGNGGVAGCFPEGVTFDPFLLDPLASIQVVCGSGVRNDGTIIIPVILAKTASISGGEKTEPDSGDRKTASDELESKFKKVNEQFLDYKSGLGTTKKR